MCHATWCHNREHHEICQQTKGRAVMWSQAQPIYITLMINARASVANMASV